MNRFGLFTHPRKLVNCWELRLPSKCLLAVDSSNPTRGSDFEFLELIDPLDWLKIFREVLRGLSSARYPFSIGQKGHYQLPLRMTDTLHYIEPSLENIPGPELSLSDLSKYYHLPAIHAAPLLGICISSLKRICRKKGLERWPYRKVSALDTMIHTLEEYTTEPEAVTELEKLQQKREYLLKNPNVSITDLVSKSYTNHFHSRIERLSAVNLSPDRKSPKRVELKPPPISSVTKTIQKVTQVQEHRKFRPRTKNIKKKPISEPTNPLPSPIPNPPKMENFAPSEPYEEVLLQYKRISFQPALLVPFSRPPLQPLFNLTC